MTLSEIADWDIEAQLRFEACAMHAAVNGDYTDGSFHLANWQDKPHRVVYDAVKLMEAAAGRIAAQAEALKIATEALELAEPSLARVHRAHIARKALARIKSV